MRRLSLIVSIRYIILDQLLCKFTWNFFSAASTELHNRHIRNSLTQRFESWKKTRKISTIVDALNREMSEMMFLMLLLVIRVDDVMWEEEMMMDFLLHIFHFCPLPFSIMRPKESLPTQVAFLTTIYLFSTITNRSRWKDPNNHCHCMLMSMSN